MMFWNSLLDAIFQNGFPSCSSCRAASGAHYWRGGLRMQYFCARGSEVTRYWVQIDLNRISVPPIPIFIPIPEENIGIWYWYEFSVLVSVSVRQKS